MVLSEYHYESEGPLSHKKKRNRERKYTRRFVTLMRSYGARAVRYPDDSNLHMPYDGHIFAKGTFMSFEAKFKAGGLTFNVDVWRREQPHQYDALKKDFENGAKSFLLIIWKPKHRIEYRALPLHLVSGKLKLANMHSIESLDDLLEM